MNRTVFRVLLSVLAIAVVWAPARACEPSRDNVPMRPAVHALTPTHLSSVDATALEERGLSSSRSGPRFRNRAPNCYWPARAPERR